MLNHCLYVAAILCVANSFIEENNFGRMNFKSFLSGTRLKYFHYDPYLTQILFGKFTSPFEVELSQRRRIQQYNKKDNKKTELFY